MDWLLRPQTTNMSTPAPTQQHQTHIRIYPETCAGLCAESPTEAAVCQIKRRYHAPTAPSRERSEDQPAHRQNEDGSLSTAQQIENGRL